MTSTEMVGWWKFLIERFALFNRTLIAGSTVHVKRDVLDYYHHACRN